MIETELLKRIKSIRSSYENSAQGSLPKTQIITLTRELIVSLFGQNSQYLCEIDNTPRHDRRHIAALGILNALEINVKSGYTNTLIEEAHADIYSEAIGIVDDLLNNKPKTLKDPAAMVLGATLEIHLRKLCEKNSIKTTKLVNGKEKNKLMSELNDTLYKGKVYNKLQNKDLIPFIDIRNSAMHGKFTEYETSDVKRFREYLNGFMLKYSA